MTPKREQRRQKTAITLLDPRHPNLSTRPEAMGAKRNVPTPEPQTQTPGDVLLTLDTVWCGLTCGQVESPGEILTHRHHGGHVHQTQPDT